MMAFIIRCAFSNSIWIILTGVFIFLLILMRISFDITKTFDERKRIDVRTSFDVTQQEVNQYIAQSHINKLRKENIEKVCKENPHLYHMMVDTKRNIAGLELPFIWCRIPKSGTTTFYRILKTIQSKDSMSNPYAIAGLNARIDQEKYFQELNFTLYKEIKNYTKIMIVRDPISRLISAYFDKFISIKPQFWCLDQVKGFQMNRTGTSFQNCPACNISFSDFLGFITNNTEAFVNIHWTPIYKICNPCGLIQYDIIGKLETFKQDVLYFLHEIDSNFNNPFEKMSDKDTNLDIIAREVDILTLNADEAMVACGYSIKYLITRVFNGLVSKGVISQAASLPNLEEPDAFYTNERIRELLTGVFIKYKGPTLTHDDVRRNMLKDIPDTILERIFDIYKYDFEIFQYNASI